MNVKKYFQIVGTIFLAICVMFAGLSLGKWMAKPFEQGNGWDDVDTVTEKGKVNFLVMGTDKDGLRTDVMMLFCMDMVNESICMLSIPRDTRVMIGNNYQKINAAYAINQEELAVKTVRQLTGLPIHNYFVIDFEGFREIIDELGGVEFDVPPGMHYEDPYQDLYIHLEPGLQVLDGAKSEQLLRFRQYAMGDLDRIGVQQEFLAALVDQKLSAKYIAKAPSIYSSVNDHSVSNMSATDVLNYATIVGKLGIDSIDSMMIPGEPLDINGASYFICDENEMEKVANNIINYGSFEAPADAVPTAE